METFITLCGSSHNENDYRVHRRDVTTLSEALAIVDSWTRRHPQCSASIYLGERCIWDVDVKNTLDGIVGYDGPAAPGTYSVNWEIDEWPPTYHLTTQLSVSHEKGADRG